MKKFPKGSVLFLRVVRCDFCGNRVIIVKNLDPTKFIYQEEHVSDPGELCSGSDMDVNETEDKKK